MKKNILIISYFFPPINSAGVYRLIGFSKYLRGRGWEPHILTVKNPYGIHTVDQELEKRYPPDIEVVRTISPEGKRLHFKVEEGSGIISFFKKVINRLLSILDLHLPVDSLSGWIPLTLIKAISLYKGKAIDVVLTSSPPHSSHLIGLIMKKTLGIKWIVDFRDPWTQFPFFERKPYLTRRINKGLEKVVLRYADRVIANTPSNRENLLREYPFIEGKVEVITNGFDPENIMAVKEVNHTANLDSKFVFVYTGELYRRMSDGLFNALYDLKKNSPDISERIEIKIAGLMWEEDIARIEELNIGDIVKYLGFISSSECNRLLAEADALLYLLPGSDEFKHWIPSKLYNYIASGKSILGILPDGDASAIIREVNGGYCLIPDDLRGIQEAITTLMSRKGEITFQRTPELENYSYVQLTKKLSLLCDQVTDLS